MSAPSDYEEYNPLDYNNLVRNVVQELMRRGPYPLPPAEPFDGPGVYARFYVGTLPFYQPVASPDASVPIYVGKAVPAGARKGARRRETPAERRRIYNRLREHARSIELATNLSPDDFLCRFLVVTPLWITMAERLLINHYQPVWNSCIDGFGIHDPGGGRYKGELPMWDVLHPGRSWGGKLQQTRTVADVTRQLQECLATDEPSEQPTAEELMTESLDGE